MSPPAVAARGLVREFRGFRAVDEVDLDVAPGALHALVGPNGAGKTTLFHLLSAFLPMTAGRVVVGDDDITGLAPDQVARLGIARSFQITSLFPQMTVRDHVILALAGRSGLGWRFWRSDKQLRRYTDAAMSTLELVDLAGFATGRAEVLSYGRKRALELALALALEPRVLLLDEPTAGMGTEDIARTVDLIARIRAGRTVVMVEHNMNVVAQLADRVTVLASGSVLAEGTYDEVRADARVIDAYLGAGHASN
jgi:branched-chain amino acid transport system ATP-binding protein